MEIVLLDSSQLILLTNSTLCHFKVSGTIMHKIKCYFKKDTDNYLTLFYFKVSGTMMRKIKCYFKKDTDSYLILFYFKVSGTMMHKIKCTDCEELRKCNIIHQTGLKVVLSPDHLIAFHCTTVRRTVVSTC